MPTDNGTNRPDEVDQRAPQARGHLMRTGHKLSGYYVPTDIHPGIVRLVRTCECAESQTVSERLAEIARSVPRIPGITTDES